MMKVRISGPAIKRATRALYLAENPSNPHQTGTEELSNGDLYIHVRLGYKAMAVMVLVVTQAIVAVIHDQFHLI
jgi:hypothetical protein